MIRPFTCLCLLAAAASGLYLYSEKHRTALLDRDIGRIIHTTEAAHARTGLLRAEWALLNEPGRLQDMSGRYLSLHPMAPTQFVQLADLSAHLPPPLAVAAIDTDEAAPAAPPEWAGPAPATLVSEAALPAHHPMQPARPDTPKPDLTKPDFHAGQKLAALATPHHPPHRTALAEHDAPLHDGLLAHSTPLPLASPQPMGASVYSAMARPVRPAPAARIVSAVPNFAPALGSALGSSLASGLGGGGSLPPPVPYGR